MNIIGLGGPSGSGKSSICRDLAKLIGIDLIIDDGLAVNADGKIIAGRPGKLTARYLDELIRMHSFMDEDYATEVRNGILGYENNKYALVLTLRMYDLVKMLNNLKIEYNIIDIIDIDTIYSKDEISDHRNNRIKYCEHTIPMNDEEIGKIIEARNILADAENDHNEWIPIELKNGVYTVQNDLTHYKERMYLS